MKILVTGRGGAGSWQIRGEQMGLAIGAMVRPMATFDDMLAADAIVAVKRVPDELLANIRRSGKPWFYDVVDAYPQPECSTWDRDCSIAWLNGRIDTFAPNGVIWPNSRMKSDAGRAGSVVYHHARPGFRVATIRNSIRTIGYEGAPHYLDEWMAAIGVECARLGAAFLVNPTRLDMCDVILALRGGKWNGYAQRHWKSNVKLANAHAAGVPFIGMREDGYIETMAGGEVFVDHPQDLRAAFESIEPLDVRQNIQRRFIAATRTLDQAAKDMLCALRS